MENVFKCMWMVVITTHSYLALTLRTTDLYLCYPWGFMACSRVSFTFIILLVNQDLWIIQLQTEQFSLYYVTSWHIGVTILQWRGNIAFCVCWAVCRCQLYKNTECCTTMLLWQIFVAGKNKMCIGLHINIMMPHWNQKKKSVTLWSPWDLQFG
jgi:hypothetical protein